MSSDKAMAGRNEYLLDLYCVIHNAGRTLLDILTKSSTSRNSKLTATSWSGIFPLQVAVLPISRQ